VKKQFQLPFNCHLEEDRVLLYPSGLGKQNSILPTPVEFRRFEDSKLCPVKCLRDYQKATSSLRSHPNQMQLFLEVNKPHSPVTSSMIACRLKSVMQSAGIDTSCFIPHSTRGASASAASLAGITTKQILSTADWSSVNTFRKFYLRDMENV